MDPRDRLRRRYPGEGLSELSPELSRLRDRDKPLREYKVARETEVKVREGKVRRISKTGQTSPNAPLLKRLVRYPYRQHTVSGRRVAVAEPIPWDALGVEQRPRLAEALADLQSASEWGNPLRLHPAPRAEVPRRPTVAEWLGEDR